MFATQKAISQYAQVGLETGVASASTGKLVVMLYDGAITACHAAAAAIQQNDYEKKSAMISKAIMIVESGLRSSLDKKHGGQIAMSLDALYSYISDRLYFANIKHQVEPVNEVIVLLADLRQAWEEIASKQNVADASIYSNPIAAKA